jgi:transposase
LLELIDILDGHQVRFSGLIADQLAHHQGYLAIQQLNGIGPTLAAVLVAEVGDVRRTDPLTCAHGPG